MSQLNVIIDKINAIENYNPHGTKYALTIVDLKSDAVLSKNKLATEILAEYNSIELYLNQLHDVGHTNLQIQLTKKNGNVWVKVGDAVVLSPVQEILPTQELPSVPNIPVEVKKKKKKKNKDFAGLGLGLNAMDIMGLKSRADQLDRSEKELNDYKDENKTLKAKNEELKDELRDLKFSNSNADSKNNMITEGLKAAPALLPALLVAFKEAANANKGLAQPAEPEMIYTEVQQIMINNLSMIDDSITQVLNVVAEKIAMRKEGDTFTDQLMQLLAQHKLKVV